MKKHSAQRRQLSLTSVFKWASTAAFAVFGVLGLMLTLGFSSVAFAQEKWTLRQAVENALQNSPEGETAIRTEKNSRLNEKNTWSSLLPSLDAELSKQIARPNPLIYDPHDGRTDSLSITIKENLYDNGDTWRLAQISSLQREEGALTLSRSRQNIALKVVRAFYDYSSSVSSFDLGREQLETLRKQFRAIEGRYRQGVSSNRDFLRIKASVQSAEIEMINSQSSIEGALSSLREAIGAKTHVEFVPIVLQPGVLDEGPSPTVTPEDTLDFRIAKLEDRVSELRFRTVERQYWPRLSLQGAYSYNIPQVLGQNRIAGYDDPYWNATASIVLDYNLWDWGIRRRNVEVAENLKQIEFAKQETTRITVTQELDRLLSQLKLLRQSFQESRQLLKSNQDVFESVNRDYREGKVSYLDLITALGTFYGSRSQILTLQFNFLKSQAELASYQGNLDEILLRP